MANFNFTGEEAEFFRLNNLLRRHRCRATPARDKNEDDVVFDRDVIFFKLNGSVWKREGKGTIKLLKNMATGVARLVKRQGLLGQELNGSAIRNMFVRRHAMNGACCFWFTGQHWDGNAKDGLYCIKFHCVEDCSLFLQKSTEVGEFGGWDPEKLSCKICLLGDGTEFFGCNCPYMACKSCQTEQLTRGLPCEVCGETWTLEAPAVHSQDSTPECRDESGSDHEIEGYPD